VRLRITPPRVTFAHRVVLGAAASRRLQAASTTRARLATKAVVIRQVDRDGDGRSDASRRVTRSFGQVRLQQAGDVADVLRRRNGGDGSVSVQTAVDEFSALIAPLPGGRAVPGLPRPVRSGTSAARHVLRHWDRLTQSQRDAVETVLAPPVARAAQASDLDTMVTRFAHEIGARTGRALQRPIRLVQPDVDVLATDGLRRTLAVAVPVISNGAGRLKLQRSGALDTCYIFVAREGRALEAAALRGLIAHEVSHCWQFEVLDVGRAIALGDWLAEGSATWVMQELGGVSAITRGPWTRWFTEPSSLYKRDYDAVAFYAQLADAGVDLWRDLESILAPVANERAFRRAVSLAPDWVLARLATSLLRRPAWGAEWDVDARGVPATVHRVPVAVPVATGQLVRREVPPATQLVFDIDAPRGAVVTVRISAGHGALYMPRRGTPGSTILVAGDHLGDYCIGGRCDCPAAATATGGSPVLAIASAATSATLTLSLKECDEVDLGVSTLGYFLVRPPNSLAPVGIGGMAPTETLYWNLTDGVDCRYYASEPTSKDRSCLALYTTRERFTRVKRVALPRDDRTWPTNFTTVQTSPKFGDSFEPPSDIGAYAFDQALANAQAQCMALPEEQRAGVLGYKPMSEKLTLTRLAHTRHPWSKLTVATRVQLTQVTRWVPHGYNLPIDDHACIPSLEVTKSVTLETSAADRARMERERRNGAPRNNGDRHRDATHSNSQRALLHGRHGLNV
jgi:hypothetical protein